VSRTARLLELLIRVQTRLRFTAEELAGVLATSYSLTSHSGFQAISQRCPSRSWKYPE
jgi:hypothetical protein